MVSGESLRFNFGTGSPKQEVMKHSPDGGPRDLRVTELATEASSTRESVTEQGWVCLCESTCPGQRRTVTGALLGPGNKVIKTKSLPSGSSLSGESQLGAAPGGPRLSHVPYLPLVQISKRACSVSLS